MWKLYCLPGRIFTELGYLFPGRNQLWASARRRESGVAAFIYATMFWAVFAFFVIPVIIAKVAGTSAKDRGESTVTVPPPTALATDATTIEEPPEPPPRSEQPRSQPPLLPKGEERAPKPTIVFAPPHEVVQPLPPENPD